jgi:hypothetical protein
LTPSLNHPEIAVATAPHGEDRHPSRRTSLAELRIRK